MFSIGQKVECIDASPSYAGDTSDLVKGRRYTVSEVVSSIGILLHEIPVPDEYEWFRASRFRPVVEKKTDISVFEEILRRETIDDGPVVTEPRKRKVSERSERIVP